MIWSAVTASYYKMISEIRKGVRYITEMDTALTEIGMVTNQTREQTTALAKEYNNLAKEMKVTTSEITSGAVEFYRQGLSQEEVMERLKTTTMYSKVANVDFKESAELLTATVNSMGIEIEHAADVFLFLGDATATSGAEIAKGFSKTGGSVAALGLEFEKVASWIAVISARTRESAESIGHSISTILSRMSRITQKGFDEEDNTSINDVAKALKTINIEIMDNKGNFKDFGTILDLINGKWSSLNDETKAYIANTIAGTRQQSRFYNLMEGYSESIDLYNESLEAAGTAQSKFNLYMESNQATIDTFKASLEGFWTSFLDSDALMTIIRLGTSLIETLDAMVQKFGSIKSVLGILIPLIGVKLTLALRGAYAELVKANGTAIGITLGQAVKKMLGLTVTTEGATVALGALNLKLIAVTAGLSLIPLLISKIANAEKERKEAFSNAVDDSQKINDEVQSLESLIKKQEELIKIEHKTTEQKDELLKVQKELAQLYPELTTGIDDEGNKIADNLEMTKQLTEEKKKLLEQELLVINTTAEKKLPKLKQELEEMQKEAEDIQRRLTTGDTKEMTKYQNRNIEIDKTDKLKDKLLELIKAQQEHREEIEKLKNGVKSYNQILEENAERQKWTRVEELSNQSVKTHSISQLQDIEKELKNLGFTSDDIAKIMSGNLDEVREKYDVLTDSQIENLMTVEDLNETSRLAAIDRLERSKVLTEQIKNDTIARITAIKAEMEALAALAGSKVGYSGVMAKKYTAQDMLGIDSTSKLLAASAKNDAIEANRELANVESKLKNIDIALKNVKSIGSGNGKISGTKTPKKSKSGSKSSKEPYKAEADRYAKINLELDKNNVLLQKNKTLQELTGNDLEKKLKLMDEEIELEKKRQDLLNQLNQQRRARGKQLQEELSGTFKFKGSWDDNSISILNPEKLEGQSKKVEEKYKELVSIMKELPQTSQEWWDILKNIEQIELDKITTQFDIQDRKLKSLTDSFADLEYQSQLLADDDYSGKADNIAQKLANLKTQVEQAKRELEELNKKGFKEGSKDAELYTQRQEELTQRIKDGTLAINQQGQSLIDLRESARQAWIAEQNKLYQDQQDRLSALDAIQEKIVQIIRKRGEEEKKALDKAHKEEIDSLEKRHDERKKKYQDDLDEFKKMIQAKIDALDEQYEEEDYLEQLNKEREEANRLQKEIDVLSLDDSLTARNQVIELRKQLADQNEKIAKMQQKKERDLLKKSLQDQLKDKEKDANDKESIADKTYENEKKRLEEDYNINKEFLDRKYSDEQVYAEARESIMRGQVEVAEGVFRDIYDAFSDFEDKFGKGMGILGDIIRDDFTKELEKARDTIKELDYLASNRLQQYDSDYNATDEEIGWEEPTDYYSEYSNNYNKSQPKTIEEYSQIYKQAREDLDWQTMEWANRQANILRGLGNVVTSIKDIEYIKNKAKSKGYKNGGKITETGTLIAPFHGTQSNPEWIFNDKQLQNILNKAVTSTLRYTVPKVPNVVPRQDTILQIDNLINVEGNLDKDILPKVERMGNNAIDKLVKNLNKKGIRPVRV